MMSENFSWDFSDWETALGLPSESLEDNITGADEIKLSSRLTKTEEEIERLTVDESLNEVERALFLLKNGIVVQKQSVLQSLKRLCKEHATDVRNRIFPLLLEVIGRDTPAFQIIAGKSMIQLLETGDLPPKNIQSVLPVAKKLLQSRDEEVVETWADVIVGLVRFLPPEVIELDVLPEALFDGGLAQPSQFRMWCCKVMGAAATRLEKKRIEDLFFRKSMALCQDTDYEVRKCMCEQLNLIAKGVGLELTKNEILDEYAELLIDEETVVRSAAISNIIQLLPLLDVETKQRVVVPQFKRLCDDKTLEIQECLTKELGAFMWEMKEVLTPTDVVFFLTFYQSTVMNTQGEIRGNCAYNFPGILKFIGAERFQSMRLDKILDGLATDQRPKVRRRIALSFHEIAALLGKNSFYLLRETFVRLLNDDHPDVYGAIFKSIDAILASFVTNESCKNDTQFQELLLQYMARERKLIEARDTIPWRVHHDFLKQCENFADYFDADTLFEICVPTFFKLVLEQCIRPIKKTLIATLCGYLRKMKRLEYRERMCREIQDTARASTYRTRMLFLEFCQTILGKFSHRFFKDYFFMHFLDLSRDSVPNIRIKVCKLFPEVRKTLHPVPSDQPLLQRSMDILYTFLVNDKDRDVSQTANEVVIKINALSPIISTDDPMDKEREEEEERIVADEWEMEDVIRRRDLDIEITRRLSDASALLGARKKLANTSIKGVQGDSKKKFDPTKRRGSGTMLSLPAIRAASQSICSPPGSHHSSGSLPQSTVTPNSLAQPLTHTASNRSGSFGLVKSSSSPHSPSSPTSSTDNVPIITVRRGSRSAGGLNNILSPNAGSLSGAPPLGPPRRKSLVGNIFETNTRPQEEPRKSPSIIRTR